MKSEEHMRLDSNLISKHKMEIKYKIVLKFYMHNNIKIEIEALKRYKTYFILTSLYCKICKRDIKIYYTPN